MITHLQDTVILNNGVKMPGFGLGVYKVEVGEVIVNAVKTAIQTGYRSIDTASFYKNEEGVGQGIQESDVRREDVFVTGRGIIPENWDSVFDLFSSLGSSRGMGLALPFVK